MKDNEGLQTYKILRQIQPKGSTLFIEALQGLSSALAVLGTLPVGTLNPIDPLVSLFNYYIDYLVGKKLLSLF